MNLEQLFSDHIAELNRRLERVLGELGIDRLVIGSGSDQYYFEDDQQIPFRTNHHFRHWCPLEGYGHLLELRPQQKPRLLVYSPDDFWHEHKTISKDFWTDQFEISSFEDRDSMWQALTLQGKVVYHGPEIDKARSCGLDTDTQKLLPRLNWWRSYKTDYEVACLVESTRLAAPAHAAARRCFLDGGSELDIYFAYLEALRAREQDLPYEAIICLNEKGAFLHYSDKRDNVRDGQVLLIDSGAAYNGYASDITRTYAGAKAPESFKRLLVDTQSMQLGLTHAVQPGMTMADLHHESHLKIAQLLIDHDILQNIKPEEAFDKQLTHVFYPHGVGHMLGLLVHDVAGRQVDEAGNAGQPDPRFPKLRSLRKLEKGHVITVEPGIYFIESLLQKQRDGDHKDHFNWSLIEELKPCGGIRIEDNVLVTEDGQKNLTRRFIGDEP
jgi:Xaa-Pro dipeptidase